MKLWIGALFPAVLLFSLIPWSEQSPTIELARTEVEINEGKASP
jgi:hypothetical protein